MSAAKMVADSTQSDIPEKSTRKRKKIVEKKKEKKKKLTGKKVLMSCSTYTALTHH